MPGLEHEEAAKDVAVESRELGSVMLTLGWILLWGVALLGIYFFESVCAGSLFWPIWLAVQGIAGLMLVIAGTRYRRATGITRLGRRSLEHTLEQEKQEQAEQNRVA